MKDTGDRPLIVHPSRSRLVLGQVRLDRRPRFIRQPEQRHARTPVTRAYSGSGKRALYPLIGFEL